MHTNLPRRRSSLSRVGWMEGCVRTESQQVPNWSAGSRQWWDVSKIFFFSFFFNTSIISTQSFKCMWKILKNVRLFMAWIFRHLSRGFCYFQMESDRWIYWQYYNVTELQKCVKIIYNLYYNSFNTSTKQHIHFQF